MCACVRVCVRACVCVCVCVCVQVHKIRSPNYLTNSTPLDSYLLVKILLSYCDSQCSESAAVTSNNALQSCKSIILTSVSSELANFVP